MLQETGGNSNFIFEALSIAALGMSNFFTWFFSRKKYRSEVKATDIQNVESMFTFYKNVINDLEIRVQKLQTKLDCLEKDFEILKDENKRLKEENNL